MLTLAERVVDLDQPPVYLLLKAGQRAMAWVFDSAWMQRMDVPCVAMGVLGP